MSINPDYLSLVPRPTTEEYRALELDIIEKKGATEPIIINERNEILDGHTRFEICIKHGLHFDVIVRKFPSILDEKLFIIEQREYIIKTNLLRRHLTDYQKIEMAKPLEELIAEKARLRMSDGGKGTSFEAPLITTKEVAKAIGVSKATYERGKKVRDKGSEEAKKRARSKKYAINSAYRETMKQQRQEQLLEQEVHNYLKGNLMLFRDNCNRLFQIHRP